MVDKKHINRIPFEDIESTSLWTLPSLEDGSKVVPSVKKKGQGAGPDVAQERVEDIEPGDVKPVTAEQLQKITEEAEREAREQGFKDGQNSGYQDGYAKGLEAGEQKAYAEQKALLEDKIERFTLLADALNDPVAMQDGELENWILDTAVKMAKHLVGRELNEDPSPLFHIVEKAVSSLPAGSKNIRIYLHADDIELAHEAFANSGSQWVFHVDPSLSRGGCRVMTEQSIVDYSVENRIRLMLEALDYQGELDESIENYQKKVAEQAPQLSSSPAQESEDESRAKVDTGDSLTSADTDVEPRNTDTSEANGDHYE